MTSCQQTDTHGSDANIEKENERNFTMSDEEKLQKDAEQTEIKWKGFYDKSFERVEIPENCPLSDEELERKLLKFDEECEEIARLNKVKKLDEKEESSSESSTDSSVKSCKHLQVSTKTFFKRLDRSNSAEATVKLEDLDGEGENEIYVRKEEEITLTESDEGSKDYRELLKWKIEPPPTNRVMLLPIKRKREETEDIESEEEKSEEWREFAVTPSTRNYEEHTDLLYNSYIPGFDESDVVTKYVNTESIEKPDGSKVDNTVIMTKSISEIRARMAEFRKSLDDFNEKYRAAAAEIFKSYNDSLPVKMPKIQKEPERDDGSSQKREKREEILAYINKDLSDPEESQRSFEHIREMLKMIAVNAEDYENSKALEAQGKSENDELEHEVQEEIEEKCCNECPNDSQIKKISEAEDMTCSLEMKLARMDV